MLYDIELEQWLAFCDDVMHVVDYAKINLVATLTLPVVNGVYLFFISADEIAKVCCPTY